MNERLFTRRVNRLAVPELILGQRAGGRRRLPSELLATWQPGYRLALRALRCEDFGRETRRLAALLREVTFPLYMLSQPQPISYYSYTDTGVIDWYLSPSHAPIEILKGKAVRGAMLLLRDLARFESASQRGEVWFQCNDFAPAIVHQRIELIERVLKESERELEASSLPKWNETDFLGTRYASLEGYARQPGGTSALLHLSCFPQTICHDEVCFLRTIHISELCFFALRVLVLETIEQLRLGQWEAAEQSLRQGTAVVQFLFRTFEVLWTMPPEHFLAFREYTERGSAVQSRNYQLLDIHLRGVDARKLPIYRENRSLRDLRLYHHPDFVSLRTQIHRLEQQGDLRWNQVREAAADFDEALLRWRGRHVAFAVKYLGRPSGSGDGAVAATGGTSGYHYLRQFLREGLFVHSEQRAAEIEQQSLLDLERALSSEWIVASRVAPKVGRRPLLPLVESDSWSWSTSQVKQEPHDRIRDAAEDREPRDEP